MRIKAMPTSVEDKEIILVDDVLAQAFRSRGNAIHFDLGRPSAIRLCVFV